MQGCGRRACLVEFDPLYCDRIDKRFETFTGKQARLAESRDTFEDVAAIRAEARALISAPEERA